MLLHEFDLENSWSSFEQLSKATELNQSDPKSQFGFEDNLSNKTNTEKIKFFEIGSGSGCISVSIIHELALQKATARVDKGLACDVCPEATELSILNSNNILGGDHELLHFFTADFRNIDPFADSSEDLRNLDFIVSNPPYIC